jgi:glycosyltransferase involved in cell wall biosynthesis
MYNISIIVCTFNRATFLKSCLESIYTHNTNLELFEVIVIDNNSTDDTSSVVKDFFNRYTNFRSFIEQRQGLSHARNRGSVEASSDWLLFLDDDGVVFDSTIQIAIRNTNSREFSCFGGVYLPNHLQGKRNWTHYSDGSNIYTQEYFGELKNPKYASGGIFLIKKEVLMHVGGFNCSIGMNGMKIAYGEETNLQEKIRSAGYKIAFDPSLRILHFYPLKKQTLKWMVESNFANGRDSWVTFRRSISPFQIFLLFAKLATLPIWTIAKAAYLSKKRRYHPIRFFYQMFAYVAYTFGKLKVSASKIKQSS